MILNGLKMDSRKSIGWTEEKLKRIIRSGEE